MIYHINLNSILKLFVKSPPELRSLQPTHNKGLQSCPLPLNLWPQGYLAEVEFCVLSEVLLFPQILSSPINIHRLPFTQPTVEGRILLCMRNLRYKLHTAGKLHVSSLDADVTVPIKKCIFGSLYVRTDLVSLSLHYHESQCVLKRTEDDSNQFRWELFDKRVPTGL